MGYVLLRRRIRRLELGDARREAAMAAQGLGGEPPVDLPALHRSIAAKKKAVQVLCAFARELAGCAPDAGPADDGDAMGCLGSPLAETSAESHPDQESTEDRAPEAPPRYRIHYERGTAIVIDTITGGVAETEAAWPILMRQPQG